MRKYSEEEVKKRVNLLSDALELIEYSKEIHHLQICMETYHFGSDQEKNKINNFLEELKNHQTINLAKAQIKLEEIRNYLGGLKGIHLHYFEQVNQAGEVLQFLSGIKNFENRLQYLTADLQGYQYGLNLLNNVISVHQLVEPLMKMISEKITLTNLCKLVCDQLNRYANEREVLLSLQKIQTVLDHLPEIRVWFTKSSGFTLDTILPFVTQLMKSGTFHSSLKLSSDGENLTLLFEEKSQMNLLLILLERFLFLIFKIL